MLPGMPVRDRIGGLMNLNDENSDAFYTLLTTLTNSKEDTSIDVERCGWLNLNAIAAGCTNGPILILADIYILTGWVYFPARHLG